MYFLFVALRRFACRALFDLGIVDDSGGRPGTCLSRIPVKQYPLPKKENIHECSVVGRLGADWQIGSHQG